MQKLSGFVKKKLDEHLPGLSPTPGGHGQAPPPLLYFPPNTPFAHEQDIYRHRKQRGVNLGAWFVQERWIADSPYRNAAAPGQSDHDIAKGGDAKNVMEAHWDAWITPNDWNYMSSKGINTVRLPIGYYHLYGLDTSVVQDTDFAAFGPVFQGAWHRIVDALRKAHEHGIGVLIDLHAAPGKQGADAHAGTSGGIDFFTARNYEHTGHVLQVLLRGLMSTQLPNIVGIELLNEPHPPSDAALKCWYTQIIHMLRYIDPGVPIYISDCWKTDDYSGFIRERTANGGIVALDHHLYRCFTKEDSQFPVAGHIGALCDTRGGTPNALTRLNEGTDIIIGEWSGALNPGSLANLNPDQEQKSRIDFVRAQLELYERNCAGWFFWTYKKQQGGDRGWGWLDAVEGGVFPKWVGVKAPAYPLKLDGNVAARRDGAKDQALNQHTRYWAQHPGQYEHWRFAEGFSVGFDDAYSFLTSRPTSSGAVPELGFKSAWVKRRSVQHVTARGPGNGVWEFETAVRQGIDAARNDFVQHFQ